MQPRKDLTKDSFPINLSATEYRIQKGDILSIQINSTVAYSDLFSKEFKADKGASGDDLYGYVVDDNGVITMPIVGDVKLEALTLREASDSLKSKLLQYTKFVMVSIKFKSIRYTVLGEVNSPGEKTSEHTRVNLIEAISKCGDFTHYSNRNNVKLIRKENNVNRVYIIDFTDKNLLTSDKFYIMPNDIIIVDTRNIKLLKENISTIRLISSFASFGILLYLRFKNII